MDVEHVFVGFGFGPIQAGLFAKEARDSGRFSEIVVSEVDPALVAAMRGNGNRYALNIAYADGVKVVSIDGVELLNPGDAGDLRKLQQTLARATEVVTSLPSVAFFARGANNVAQLLAAGLVGRQAAQTVVYTAENNNHAAEILEADVQAATPAGAVHRPVQMLNTVIGKMSQVINDPSEIVRRGLTPIVPGFPRAFLVEAFNRILVTQVRLPGFAPGITAFEQKEDLLPFEEAKLFGHNAAHTMLGFLGEACGFELLSDLVQKPGAIEQLRKAFVDESGAALVAKYARLGDPLFTPEGFRFYAEDLIQRMTNPHLADTVARATRDPLRKLGASDRLFGALRLCLAYGVEPASWAVGALAGLRSLAARPEKPASPLFEALRRGQSLSVDEFGELLRLLWGEAVSRDEVARIGGLLSAAQPQLNGWLG